MVMGFIVSVSPSEVQLLTFQGKYSPVGVTLHCDNGKIKTVIKKAGSTTINNTGTKVERELCIASWSELHQGTYKVNILLSGLSPTIMAK